MEHAREEDIRERAYAIWEQDGRPEGRSLAHWSQAEAELGGAVEDQRKPAKSRRTRRNKHHCEFRRPAARQVEKQQTWRHHEA